MSDTNSIEAGKILEGKIVKIKPFGAIVSLPDNAHGLVHISHISKDFVQDINDYISVGDIVKVKIISVDNEKSKISLSMKDAVASEEKENQPPRERRDFKKPHDRQRGGDNFENSFEDKLKDFLKVSNDRQASINKRNKKR